MFVKNVKNRPERQQNSTLFRSLDVTPTRHTQGDRGNADTETAKPQAANRREKRGLRAGGNGGGALSALTGSERVGSTNVGRSVDGKMCAAVRTTARHDAKCFILPA